jgi:isocitrate dehydrogenase
VIENALLYTLEQGIRTGDFGDKAKPALNTKQFADAIISNFGKTPGQGAKPVIPNQPMTPTVFRLEKNPMMVTDEGQQEKIVGVDMFIESEEQPEVVAQRCMHHGGTKFKLINISNRGTQVWPTGSKYTNLVNLFNARFESLNDQALNPLDIIGLYASLSGDFKIASIELLNMWGEKKGYSLAQGQ